MIRSYGDRQCARVPATVAAGGLMSFQADYRCAGSGWMMLATAVGSRRSSSVLG